MPEQEQEFTLNVDIAVSGKDPEDASIKLVRKFHRGGIGKWWIGDVQRIPEVEKKEGSGIIGLCCEALDRKFTGIERNEKYFNIAKTRIKTK